MRITLQLDDDLYAAYLKQAGSKDNVNKTIKERLAAYVDIDPDKRSYVLEGSLLTSLEALVEHPIGDAAQLVKEVEQMCTFKLGPMDTKMSPDELVRLHGMAEFHGMTSAAFLQQTIDEVMGYVLERVS